MGRPVIFEDGHDFDEAVMALDMTILCREFHVLPGPGGLLDQDSYAVYLMENALQVLSEHEKRELDQQKHKIEQDASKVKRR